MAFRLTGKCRAFFEHIYDKEGKNRRKLRLLFDEYYLCLMVGLASEMYDENPELEASEITDRYPEEYRQSRDFIAGLLIATERKRQGIPENDSKALERLMTRYLDPESRTRLSQEGEHRLNQYAARGIDILMDVMGTPYELEEFLIAYLDCFQENRFYIRG